MDSPNEHGLKLQILALLLLAVLLLLHYQLWLAEDGVRQTYGLRIAIQAQTGENAALNERNRALEADVEDLKSGLMAIEERARSEMGMIREDETFYRILEQPLPKPVTPPEVKPGPIHRKPSVTVSPPHAAQPSTHPARPH